jgi:hypothetical protein
MGVTLFSIWAPSFFKFWLTSSKGLAKLMMGVIIPFSMPLFALHISAGVIMVAVACML